MASASKTPGNASKISTKRMITLVGAAAVGAGGEAEGDACTSRDPHRDQADRKRDASAPQYAREDVAPEPVGAHSIPPCPVAGSQPSVNENSQMINRLE